MVFFLLYVADMLITSNDDMSVSKLRTEFSIHFKMKDLGELNHFLRLEVENMKGETCVSKRLSGEDY